MLRLLTFFPQSPLALFLFVQLIIDGIAAAFRMTSDARSELLGVIASQLKYLSATLGLSVVVTNQVTTRIPAPLPPEREREGTGQSSVVRHEAALVAALGVGWAHAVNTRFMLETLDSASAAAASAAGISSAGGSPLRLLRVAKSPSVAYQQMYYSITEAGAAVVGAPASASAVPGSVITMTMQPTHSMTVGARKQ